MPEHCLSLISSGIYGYPKEEALEVATNAIREFLRLHDMDVFLAVFDRASFQVSSQLMGAVESYIDENYVSEHTLLRPRCYARPSALGHLAAADSHLDTLIEHLDEPFNETLLRLIDAKGLSDAEVYHRANIDRKLFSKIRIGKGYMPSKRTALALAVALKLTLEETDGISQNWFSFSTAAALGIRADRAADYAPDEKGTRLNYEAMSEAITSYRACGAMPKDALDGIPKDPNARGKRRK